VGGRVGDYRHDHPRAPNEPWLEALWDGWFLTPTLPALVGIPTFGIGIEFRFVIFRSRDASQKKIDVVGAG